MSLIQAFKKILNKIKKESNIIAVLAFVIFLFSSVAIFENISVTKENISDYQELIENPYEEYERFIRRSNVRKLIESKQFEEMKYSDDLIKEIDLNDTEKGKNPFLKMF